MDKILITGVAGFIGSNLANYLLKNENNIVYGLDNFSTSSFSNLYPLLRNERFHFIEHDLVQDIPFSVDYVYHCAGCGDLNKYFNNKYNFIIGEFDILKNIVSYSKHNCAKLVVLSSYFDYLNSNSELHQYYDYTILKESLISDLILNAKISANIVRLGEVYGENMLKSDKRFIPSLIMNVLNGDNIEISSEIKYSFQYIEDVVQNLNLIATSNLNIPIINLMTDALFSQKEVINTVNMLLNTSFEPTEKENLDEKEYYFTYLNKDNELLCKTELSEGLKRTIEHFKLMYFS